MKKSELRSGMVVEYRNGDRRLVLDGGLLRDLILLGRSCHSLLSSYGEDLRSRAADPRCADRDIMKVFTPHITSWSRVSTCEDPVWERQERNPEIERLEKLIDDAKEQIQKLKD